MFITYSNTKVLIIQTDLLLHCIPKMDIFIFSIPIAQNEKKLVVL